MTELKQKIEDTKYREKMEDKRKVRQQAEIFENYYNRNFVCSFLNFWVEDYYKLSETTIEFELICLLSIRCYLKLRYVFQLAASDLWTSIPFIFYPSVCRLCNMKYLFFVGENDFLLECASILGLTGSVGLLFRLQHTYIYICRIRFRDFWFVITF